MRKTISNILIIVFSAIIAFSGYRLWTIFHEYHVGEKQYEQTATNYVHQKDPDNTMAENGPQECPITVDFEGLLAENSDVVGWIYSEGTQINYPVLRGDSNETYLYHMINGEYNSSGSIFMDFRCNPDLSDFNTIIYGHHMKNGSMFASLHQYIKEIYTIFTDLDQLRSYLSFAQNQSTFVPDAVPDDINGIVALSTCSYEYDDARYVLVCVPVMID